MASISGSSSAASSERHGAVRWCSTRPAAFAAVVIIGGAASVATVGGPRFYPDDPLWTDDDTALAVSAVVETEDANSYDFTVNTFSTPGERRDVRAMNVNTLDEVPDSSWFVNRIGRHPMSVADLVRGPDRFESISLDGWVVSGSKATGVQPGFRMTDPDGHTYQIEVDPPSNPEMATGAEIIGTAFYHAFGYHTVDVYLAELDPDRIVIAATAKYRNPFVGERRRLLRRDIDNVLRHSARQANGKYRVLASRFADGMPLGNFRYKGTRPDDPNDIVPHEHRRELRAARAFGAWLNHDDSRGINSLDMLVEAPPRRYVKHYMFDFGSIMGSGTIYPQRHRAGNEYILEWKPGWLTLATLGVYTRSWMRIAYPDVPDAVGRFEGEAFRPELWRPEYPNPAFENMRPDDAFWAARIIARFDAASVRAIVDKARYTDPTATEYITQTLLRRREKILRTWLTGVNPVVDLSLDEAGVLRFSNAAVTNGVASAPDAYVVQWSRFQNDSGRTDTLAEAQESADAEVPGPVQALRLAAPGDYVQVAVSARHADFPAWSRPVIAHFRRAEGKWELVGLQRIPD